jgi:serine/threonine protein kinase
MIGTLLSHYRIVERLGAGGMGVVYKAVDERLQRDVAIKVLPEGLLRDDEARRRFRHEARAAARIIHPHIGTVLDFDSAGTADFLVMEYVAGESLEHMIARPEQQTALGLGAQIADALEALHELGVLHCDLKPGNVIVTPRGQAKLLDFGLARLARDPERSARTSAQHAIAGTLPYLAPEQIENCPLDGRVDLHGLGVLLYEMTTGRRPFEAVETSALLYAIVNTEAPAVRTLRADLSAALEALIARAMEKRTERRFGSAREMKLAIEAVLAGTAPAPAAARAAEVSIAVLPLANLSTIRSRFFADGMTEALIADRADRRLRPDLAHR